MVIGVNSCHFIAEYVVRVLSLLFTTDDNIKLEQTAVVEEVILKDIHLVANIYCHR